MLIRGESSGHARSHDLPPPPPPPPPPVRSPEPPQRSRAPSQPQSAARAGATRDGDAPERAPYTQQQATTDAKTLWDATRGGVTGWGTDEKAIFTTLEDKDAAEIDTLKQAFEQNYRQDLGRVLDDELSGADRDHARALMRGREHRAASDAVVVDAELEGVFGDEQEVLNVLESRPASERGAIALAYAGRHGGPGDEAGARDFLLDRMDAAGGFSTDDLTRAKALLAPPGGDVAEGDARAAAAKVKVAVDGMGTDEDTLKQVFDGKTIEEVQGIQRAYALAYGQPMRERLDSELGGSDREWVNHLLNPASSGDPAAAARWQAGKDAVQVHAAVDGAGTDEGALRDLLSGKSPDELKAIDTAYREAHGVGLRERLDRDLGGSDGAEILHLLEAPDAGDPAAAGWQARQDALRLNEAVDGAGTDEDRVREVLGSRSKSEIDAIAQAFRSEYGEDLRGRLASELDGRDEFELLGQQYDRGKIDFAADPRGAIAEQIRRGREMAAHEAGLGTDAIEAGQQLFRGDSSFETDGERLGRTLDDAERALQRGDLAAAARHAGFSEQNVRSLVETKNAASEAAATGAAVVAATTVTIATAGSASPLMVMALSGAAGGVSSGATYGALNSQAGGTELLRQVSINAASGATGALPIGRGGGVAMSLADDAVSAAGRGGASRALKETATEGAWVGGQNGFADGAVRTSTESRTWDDGIGRGLQQVALHGAMGGAGGAVIGGGTGALLSPLMRGRFALPGATPEASATSAARSGPQVDPTGGATAPAYLPRVGLPAGEVDSGGVAAMVRKFASPEGLREFIAAVSSTARVKRHNTSSWITGRVDPADYARLQVPLKDIRSQHSIDGAAAEKTAQRAERVRDWLERNPKARSLDMGTLDELAGSSGSIQVGWHGGDRFITLDGVGRVEAVRTALRRYEADHGTAHPLQNVETYATRLTDAEFKQLHKTSTYFRDADGVQRPEPQHDLVPYTAVLRFAVGTAMNMLKQKAAPLLQKLPMGPAAPDRRLPAELLQRSADEGHGEAGLTALRQAGRAHGAANAVRDPEIGAETTVADLLANPLRPGAQGVTLKEDEIRMGDLYTLSQATGVEYALAIEHVDGRNVFKLYSGTAYGSGVPPHTTYVAHTHPNEHEPSQRFPSNTDMQSARDILEREQQADGRALPRELMIIWGPGDKDHTTYYGGLHKAQDEDEVVKKTKRRHFKP